MTTLTLRMQMPLDGNIEGPGGALDWPVVNEELQGAFTDELRRTDAFVYGRQIFEMMASFWPTADAQSGPSAFHADVARIWKEKPKAVFSRTLARAEWNTTIVGATSPTRCVSSRDAHPMASSHSAGRPSQPRSFDSDWSTNTTCLTTPSSSGVAPRCSATSTDGSDCVWSPPAASTARSLESATSPSRTTKPPARPSGRAQESRSS